MAEETVPLLGDEAVVMDGTQHHHWPLVHPLQCHHGAVDESGCGLSLLHRSLHL